MSLFLPRELFSTTPAPAAPLTSKPATPATGASTSASTSPSTSASNNAPGMAAAVPPRTRTSLRFGSADAVAADLLRGPTPVAEWPTTPRDRRRKPRTAAAGGVDLYLDDLKG